MASSVLNTKLQRPRPTARVSTAASEKPGFVRTVRNAKRRSCQSRSAPAQPQASLVSSLMRVMFPNPRCAEALAESAASPRSIEPPALLREIEADLIVEIALGSPSHDEPPEAHGFESF